MLLLLSPGKGIRPFKKKYPQKNSKTKFYLHTSETKLWNFRLTDRQRYKNIIENQRIYIIHSHNVFLIESSVVVIKSANPCQPSHNKRVILDVVFFC